MCVCFYRVAKVKRTMASYEAYLEEKFIFLPKKDIEDEIMNQHPFFFKTNLNQHLRLSHQCRAGLKSSTD